MIDEHVRLTDCAAIMVYICSAYAPELLGSTVEIKARLDMLYAQLKDVKSAITGPCYVGTDRIQLKETAKVRIAPIVTALGKDEYIAGAELTYLDFLMLELCEFVEFLTEDFYQDNKTIARYVKKIKGLKPIKKYIAST